MGSLRAKIFCPTKSHDVLEMSIQSASTQEGEEKEVQECITCLDVNMSYPLYESLCL